MPSHSIVRGTRRDGGAGSRLLVTRFALYTKDDFRFSRIYLYCVDMFPASVRICCAAPFRHPLMLRMDNYDEHQRPHCRYILLNTPKATVPIDNVTSDILHDGSIIVLTRLAV
jgi:hypothetical protein